MFTSSNQRDRGFTLIELLIVIAIIGLLSTLAVVSLTSAQRSARDTKRVADLKATQTALELFYNENAAYPTYSSGDDWSTDFTASLASFISPLPEDPTNNTTYRYSYHVNSTGATYYLGATLEDDTNSVLNNDNDDNVTGASGDALLQSDGTSAFDTSANLNCSASGVYCLTTP